MDTEEKVTLLPKKLELLIELFNPIVTEMQVISALDRDSDIPALPMISSELHWDRARIGLLTAEAYSPMERAHFRKMIELADTEDLVAMTIENYKYLSRPEKEELVLLVRKAVEILQL